jgi:hypothetical protein
MSLTAGGFLAAGPEVLEEEEGTAMEGALCELEPEMGTELLPPLLFEVDMVTIDDVDRFRALGGMSDSLGAGSCSLSNLPIAGFCTTFKVTLAIAPSQGGQDQYLVPPDGLAHLVRKVIENLLVVFGDKP